MEATSKLYVPQDIEKCILDRWSKLKRSRIRVAPAAANTRASSIGHPCDRFLFYERTDNQQRAPHDEDTQSIFDVGNEYENYTLRELEESGIRIVQRGRDFVDRRLELSGHIDARLYLPELNLEVQAEIKSLNPYTWERIETYADILNAKEVWLRRYPAQLQTYLFLSSEEIGVFILVNKSTGKPKVIAVPLDYAYAESLIQKAERVRDAVKADVAPDRLAGQPQVCGRCPFKALCCPPIENPGVQFLDDEVAVLLDRRAELDAAASEYDAIEKQLKTMVVKPGEYLAGRWVIVAKEVDKKAFSVKASKYIKREYELVKGETK